LQRDYNADGPNEQWLADITHISMGEGWLYLAAVLDLYSRRVPGCATSDRVTSDLAIAALQTALVQRQPEPGLLRHSDQGSQHTDRKPQTLIRDHGLRTSMNAAGR
jgi:putative transposase